MRRVHSRRVHRHVLYHTVRCNNHTRERRVHTCQVPDKGREPIGPNKCQRLKAHLSHVHYTLARPALGCPSEAPHVPDSRKGTHMRGGGILSLQCPEHCLCDIRADVALNRHAIGTSFDDFGKRLILGDDGCRHFFGNARDSS
jgi:hypothetical protein